MMKRIQLKQLSTIKTKNRFILVSYQDIDLLNDFCQTIIQQQQIDETDSIDILNASDWEVLLQTQQNYRLFPEPKAYLIHFDKASLNAKQLPQFNPDNEDLYILCTPIFKHPHLDKLITANKLEWFGLYAPFNHDLWLYFQAEMSRKTYSFDPSIHSWWTETSLIYMQVKQLIEKLILHYPEPKMLELNEIQAHLGLSQHQDTQDLIDAWMNQCPDQIITLLDKIKTSDLSLLIWIIQRNLMVLDALKTAPNSSQDIFQQHKIWPKQTASFIKLSQCLTKDTIAQLLCLLQDIDVQFKTHHIRFAMQKLQYLFLYCASLKP